jgi:hypothetical protein
MSTLQLLDTAGRRRSPATLPGFHAGRPPRNKGFRYPPDPPRVEEIVAVMRRAGNTDRERWRAATLRPHQLHHAPTSCTTPTPSRWPAKVFR